MTYCYLVLKQVSNLNLLIITKRLDKKKYKPCVNFLKRIFGFKRYSSCNYTTKKIILFI